jgi:tol-pal system protein YbgF
MLQRPAQVRVPGMSEASMAGTPRVAYGAVARVLPSWLLAAGVLVSAASVLPAAAAGAVPVVESVGVSRGGAQSATGYDATAPGSIAPQGTPWHGGEASAPMLAASGGIATGQPMAGAAAGGQNAELFFQIQTLQQEVAELRGLVEELTHQVNRLASDQQAQYRDLDGRIVALRGAAPPASAPVPGAPAAPVPQPAPAAAGAQMPAPAQAPAAGQPAAGEREAYSAAFELMRARKFPEATAAFSRFVRDYPNGGYTANSFYWLGELYLAQDNLEQARQSFTQVLNLYPDSQKVPDSLYKLGVVQHRLGDATRAREYLNRAVSQYPGSSAAALAQTYLSEIQ